MSLNIQPLAVDKIRVRWTMSTYENELTAEELEGRLALWNEVNREDREKLERMQRVLGSRHAPSGVLAPHDLEGTIWDFYRYLSRRIAPYRAGSAAHHRALTYPPFILLREFRDGQRNLEMF